VITIDHVEPKEPGARFFDLDLVNASDGELDSAGSELGALGLRRVVSTVGGPMLSEFEQKDPLVVPTDVINATLALNLVSAFRVLRMTLPGLRRSSGDRSITLSSSINEFGGFGAPCYSAAKAGIRGLVAEAGRALAPEGIRVNGVSLGTTATLNHQRIRESRGLKGRVEELGARTSRGTILTALEAAQAIACVSESLVAMSGEVITCDAAQARRRN
jgi:NAD(P)-dependent dehydrogenase (short-subunit alcohol dehydrogenase family)